MKFFISTLAALILLNITSIAQSETYYISSSASDDLSIGTSTSAPWSRSPGMKGFNGNYTPNPDDIFIFKGGETWDSNNFPLIVQSSGLSPNTFYTFTIDESWFLGSNFSYPTFDLEHIEPCAINIKNLDYIKVEKINFINPADPSNTYNSVVYIESSNNITINNSIIDSGTSLGDSTPIILLNISFINITNNYLRSGSSDENPDVILIRPWWKMEHISILNNEILSESGDGIHIHVEDVQTYSSTYPQGNLTFYGPITIEGNDFHDFSGSKFPIIIIGGAKNLFIKRNKFHGLISTGSAIRFGNVNSFFHDANGNKKYYWYNNVQVHDNIFYNITTPVDKGWGIISLYNTDISNSSSENYIYNNSIWQSESNSAVDIGFYFAGTNNASWRISNNIISGFNRPFFIKDSSSPEISSNVFYNYNTSSTFGSNAIFGNPFFADPENGDLSILEQSPANGNGSNLSSLDSDDTLDYARFPRSTITAWDIGAYEIRGIAPTAPSSVEISQ